MQFGTVDYIVFTLNFIITVAVGILFIIKNRHRNRRSESYFLGNRTMSVIPVAISHTATVFSAYSLLGVPAETYVYGFSYTFNIASVIFGLLFAILFVAPMMYKLKLTSLHEYFYLRYNGQSVRYVAVFMTVLWNLVYSGIILFVTAVGLTSTLQMPFWTLVILYVVITGLYTAFGGFVTVIWTDVYQFIIRMAGILVVIGMSITGAGGMHEVLKYNKERLDIWEFSPNPTIRHSFWMVTFGKLVDNIYNGTNQQSMQRCNSLKNIWSVRVLLTFTLITGCFITLTTTFTGLSIFAFYSAEKCDPLAADKIANVNQIVTFAVVDMFRRLPGMAGLFIAAVSCASLSSLSSNMISLAAIFYVDFLRVQFPNMSDQRATSLSKVAVLVLAAVFGLLAIIFAQTDGSLPQIAVSFMGSSGGPFIGMLGLSLFWRRTTSNGAIIGCFLGFAFSLWIALGKAFSTTLPKTPWMPLGPTSHCYTSGKSWNGTDYDIPYFSNAKNWTDDRTRSVEGLDKLYSLSYMMIPILGFLTTVLFGVVISFMTKPLLLNATNESCILKITFSKIGKSKTIQTKEGDEDEQIELRHELNTDATG